MINTAAFKGFRKRKGLTQQELADKAGITRGMVAKYETSAAEPSLQTAYKMARALEVNIEDLIAKEDTKPT